MVLVSTNLECMLSHKKCRVRKGRGTCAFYHFGVLLSVRLEFM